MIQTARMFLFATALALMSVAPRARAADAERIPMPDAAAQQKAMKTIDAVYREEAAAARTAEQKQALARKWLKAGEDTKDDPAARFVLIAKAKDVACEAGDVATALA